MYDYAVKEGNQEAQKYVPIPDAIFNKIIPGELKALKKLLDLSWETTRMYTPMRYKDEMQGIADATGIDYLDIRRINLFPELTRAACTMIGAWGESTSDGQLYQLRALDWSPDAPVNKHPMITVYHSKELKSHAFANIGFAGFIGSITAVNEKGIALSEKVWDPKKGAGVKGQFVGKPWAFMFRDLAQFTQNLDEAVSAISDTRRTVKIHLGIGSKADQSFLGIEYAANEVFVFNHQNYTYNSDAHPQLENVFYWDKHPQPSGNACLGNILSANYGQINAETFYREVVGYSQTGDAQVCVFDINRSVIYVSYSSAVTEEYAYYRSMMQIDLKPYFSAKFD